MFCPPRPCPTPNYSSYGDPCYERGYQPYRTSCSYDRGYQSRLGMNEYHFNETYFPRYTSGYSQCSNRYFRNRQVQPMAVQGLSFALALTIISALAAGSLQY